MCVCPCRQNGTLEVLGSGLQMQDMVVATLIGMLVIAVLSLCLLSMASIRQSPQAKECAAGSTV